MSTASVLELMTASVVQGKIAAGAKLTPVGIEATKITGAAPALPPTKASFPNDVPDEAILQRVSIIRGALSTMAEADRIIHDQWTAMLEALAAVERELGQMDEADAHAHEAATKRAEQLADAAALARAAAATEQEAERPAHVQLLVAAAAHPDDASAHLAAIAKASTPDEKAALVAKFEEEFAAKSAAAQDATFGQFPPARQPSGWECPDHSTHVDKLSRLGRSYRACGEAGCKQFEKL